MDYSGSQNAVESTQQLYVQCTTTNMSDAESQQPKIGQKMSRQNPCT